MVEGSRHPCCKDDVPDWCGSGRDTDARRQCGLDGGRQCSLVVTQMPGGTVDWMAVGSAVIVAGVASLGTSLAGLPELEKGDKA